MTELARDVVLWSTLYVGVLLILGWLGHSARREDTLSDHFLAGRNLGFVVLLVTLFATQYSGNSLSGFPGKTYRDGIRYFMSVTFMVGIVSGYLLFAPRLFALSRLRGYVTPTDFLADRFRSTTLNYLSAVIFIVALGNFLLAQIKALGNAFAGVTGRPDLFVPAVIGGALVILVYELLGGMRAVAWTDVLQGALLAVGLGAVLVLLLGVVGTPADVVRAILVSAPAKVSSPDLRGCLVWVSTFLLLHLGAPLYPQAIQRIYAARRLRDLRHSLAIMAFIPLVAVTAVVYIGAVGITIDPGLTGKASDEITFHVLRHLVERDPRAYYPVLIVMMAVGAAIMSTADSALLSISSIVTKDIVARFEHLTDAQAERLTRMARGTTIGVLATCVILSFVSGATLWRLLVIKFEVLIQLSPAFVLGTWHDRDDRRAFTATDILAGLGTGLLTALTLYASGLKMIGGVHAGVIGVVLNYAVVLAARAIRNTKAATPIAAADAD